MRRCARWQIPVGERMVGSFDTPFECAHVYVGTEELQERFHQIEASMKRLSDGTTEVRLSLSDTRYVRARITCSIFSKHHQVSG
jgi:hypothetical protein